MFRKFPLDEEEEDYNNEDDDYEGEATE